MADEYNLESLSSTVGSDIADIKDDFLDSLDMRFLERVIHYADTNQKLGGYRDPIDIVVNSIDDVETLLQQAIDGIQDFNIPDRPTELDDGVDRDVEHVFESDQLDQMSEYFSQIYNQSIGNSGYNYDGMPSGKVAAISNALLTQEYDIDADNLDKKVDIIAGKWAADGYVAAPGSLSFDVAVAISEFDSTRKSKEKTPAVMLAKAIQNNIQSAYEAGISIEKLHMEFATKYTNFKYEKINAIIKAYIGEIEKVQMEMKGQALSIKSILKAAEVDNTVNIAEVRLTLDRELNHLQNWVSVVGSKMTTDAGLTKQQIATIEQATDGYIGLFASYGSLFSGVNIQEQAVEE